MLFRVSRTSEDKSLYGKENYRIKRASSPAGAEGGPFELGKSESSLGKLDHTRWSAVDFRKSLK